MSDDERLAQLFRRAQHAGQKGFEDWSKKLREHGG